MSQTKRIVPALALLAVFVVFAGGALAAGDEDFTVVLMPDTQNYSEKYPETYVGQAEWIKSRVAADNIRFVIHLGDIVQTAELEEEWKVADAAHKVLDGVVPYSMAVGNHDMNHAGEDITRETPLYNQYFPPSRFEGNAWYGGHMGEDNVNNYCFFEGAGMKFMVLSLEFAPSDAVLEWASGVLKAHADRRVIVATHYYLRPEGRAAEEKPYGLDGAGPEALWQRFISKHPSIFMVVCGHVLGVHHQKSTNDAGGWVHEILCDYQGEANGGDGWLQTLRFDPANKVIHVEAYSPKLDKHNGAPEHTYALPYDMRGEMGCARCHACSGN